MENLSGLTLSQYNNYFDYLPPDKSEEYLLDKRKLQEYRMRVASEGNHRSLSYKLRLLHISSKGKVVEYIATFGQFQLRLIVLHQDKASPNSRGDRPFASGGFGKIYMRTLCSEDFVGKVVRYEQGMSLRKNIDGIIREVVMCKLCSFLEIGPKVETRIPFDLICYTDCAQFHMERCVLLEDCIPTERSLHKIEEDLKICLSTLHKYHLVHRDIKPDNVLYIRRLKKFVFTDFGLAQYVKEHIGEPTEVYREGTFRYMVEALRDIKQGQAGYVNLYLADLYALRKTFNDIGDQQRCQMNKYVYSSSLSSLIQESESSSDISECKTENKGPLPSMPPEEESYEYYRVLFAVTSLFDSEFNLQENWMYISNLKKEEILKLLMGSFSIGKARRFVKEYQTMNIQNEPAFVVQFIDELRTKVREFKEPGLEPVLFTLNEIQLCRRTFGNAPQLIEIEEKLNKDPTYDIYLIVASLQRLFDAETRINYTLQQWQTLLNPLKKYLSEAAVKSIYRVLSKYQLQTSFGYYILDDYLALAQSDVIDLNSQKYLSFLSLYSTKESCSQKPEEVELAVKDVKRMIMIFQIIRLEALQEQTDRWWQWMWIRLNKDNRGLESVHAHFLYVSLNNFKGNQRLRTAEEAIAILMNNRIHFPVLLFSLLLQKYQAHRDQEQYLQALQVSYTFDEALEHYFCIADLQTQRHMSTQLRLKLRLKQRGSPTPQVSTQLLSDGKRLVTQIMDCIRKDEWTQVEVLMNRIKDRLLEKSLLLSGTDKLFFLQCETSILQHYQLYSQALKYFRETMVEAVQQKDCPAKWYTLAHCLLQSAYTCNLMKDWKQAIRLFQEAKEIDKHIVPYPSSQTLEILIELPSGYDELEEEELCRKYIRRAEALIKKGVKPGIDYVKLLNLQSHRCFFDKKYSSAISKQKMQVKILLKKQWKVHLVDIPPQYADIGISFWHLQDYRKAFTYYTKFLELQDSIPTAEFDAFYLSHIFLSSDPLESKEYAEFIQCLFYLLKVQVSKESELYQKTIKILEKQLRSSVYTHSVVEFTSSAAYTVSHIPPKERTARIRAKSVLVRILKTKIDERLRKLAVLLALEVVLICKCERETEMARQYLKKASAILATLKGSRNEYDIQERHLLGKFVVLQEITLIQSS